MGSGNLLLLVKLARTPAHPNQERSDLVDAGTGEGSSFQRSFKYLRNTEVMPRLPSTKERAGTGRLLVPVAQETY